jgi:glycosyltransferase involved in cell wall biosynthesis
MAEDKHVSICVCTYRRPELLERLLAGAILQKTDGLFGYSVVIVDNDSEESARETVETYALRSKIPIDYHVEPEQNIALARNRAVKNAKSDLIVFIDDDEIPDEDWLLNLYEAFCRFQADGILGPVKPYFETQPPGWIISSKICERRSFSTGTILRDARYTRTGNVLLKREILVDGGDPFNPLFGKTGGEDGDFFRRRLQKGNRFIWCNEACVSEIVPPERFRRSYWVRKAFLQGSAFAKSERISLLSIDSVKSFLAIMIYTPALPILILIRHDLFMKFLVKVCYHLSTLLTVCGVSAAKERVF